jgi:oligopeptide/dipeptide ABC transporter ATP-binding protein
LAPDVSVQAQIVNLLMRVQRDLGPTYPFVAHDLGVVRHVWDEAAVMHLGRIIGIGSRARVFAAPAHPCTQAPLSAVPRPAAVQGRGRARQVLAGEIPNPIDPPSGCAFRTRCPRALPRCSSERPQFAPIAHARQAACHLPG